ncbi:uncharacterized protein LOC129319953 [Prosopis cineraria]|uniref:uncharacterized protein LOC129319953 n=1 Tax=Prosopis cineraria TaxID=364024 RepID=UPI00240FA2B9|nr:uncharacterized protein LOC129319953 [Prosopis cineraria]
MAHEDPQYATQELEQEDDREEALSLCDLPLNDMSSVEVRPSSFSEASDLFEFFNDVAVSDMCPADEIIFCESNMPPSRRLRSDPISGVRFHVSRSNSVGTFANSPCSVMMQNSRSLDYRKLRRSSSSVVFMAPEAERNSSTVKRATSKPRWCSVMLGTVKAPAEMELSDMKNRQARRNPSTTMFPAVINGGGKMVENRRSGKFSWMILRALTCKDRRSVSVTTSMAVPQAT